MHKLSRDELQAKQSRAGGHLKAKELEYKQQVANVGRLEADLAAARSAALATLRQVEDAKAQYHKCLALLASKEMGDQAGPKERPQQEKIDTSGVESDPQVAEMLAKLEDQQQSLRARQSELRQLIEHKKQKKEEPPDKKPKTEGGTMMN